MNEVTQLHSVHANTHTHTHAPASRTLQEGSMVNGGQLLVNIFNEEEEA